VIHKPTTSIWNKEGVRYCISSQEGW
jgi:hypothetical protein